MEPLFFGPADQPLYGVYHSSSRPRARSEGVVLFYPTGQEYMRIHRAYRWLAGRLADDGFHVLRFDYTGQGDSAGSFEEADLDRWQQDGAAAIDELEAIGGCERIALIGTRLGATIAAANGHHKLVDRMVFWEPRSPGRLLADEFTREIDSGQWPLVNLRATDGTTHLNGFAYPANFMKQLANSQIDPEQLPGVGKVLCVTSVQGMDLSPVLDPLRNAGIEITEHFAPGPTDWNRVNGIGGVFLPQRILHDISEWMNKA